MNSWHWRQTLTLPSASLSSYQDLSDQCRWVWARRFMFLADRRGAWHGFCCCRPSTSKLDMLFILIFMFITVVKSGKKSRDCLVWKSQEQWSNQCDCCKHNQSWVVDALALLEVPCEWVADAAWVTQVLYRGEERRPAGCRNHSCCIVLDVLRKSWRNQRPCVKVHRRIQRSTQLRESASERCETHVCSRLCIDFVCNLITQKMYIVFGVKYELCS